MTIEWIRSASLALAVLGVSAGAGISCATTVSNRTGDSLDTSQYPPDIRDAYKVFAVRCSRCHTLARPLNARIRDPQQWVRYVARMRLNPASGINAKNGEIILRFLLYYMHQREKTRDGDQDTESELAPESSAGDLQPGAAALDAADADAADTRPDGPKLVSTSDESEAGDSSARTARTARTADAEAHR